MGKGNVKVLIIGGTGIISSDVTSLVCESGYEVTRINRGKRKTNGNKNIQQIVADLRNDPEEEIKAKISDYSWDVIIDFVSYTKNQLEKFLHVFDGKYQQYIFISSATVCEMRNGYISEESVDLDPKWKYVIDKLEAERYIKAYHKTKNASYTIVRPYITYSEKRLPLQFSPLEYYTNVNRILNGKPLPLCNQYNTTTMLTSKMFAVGCVGLINNSKAINEEFIIADSRTITWKEVYERIITELQTECRIVDISQEFLEKSYVRGFDKQELLADKIISKVIDNTKICNAVPEFEKALTQSTFCDFSNVISFYQSENATKQVNYKWDARIDNMLSKWYRKNSIQYEWKKLSVWGYKNQLNMKEKLNYVTYRYDIFFIMSKCISKIIRK